MCFLFCSWESEKDRKREQKIVFNVLELLSKCSAKIIINNISVFHKLHH